LLSRVDGAKRDIAKLLAARTTIELADLVELLDLATEEIEAALVDIAVEAKVDLNPADTELHDLAGFIYSRVSAG
jgi:hypothetical protein